MGNPIFKYEKIELLVCIYEISNVQCTVYTRVFREINFSTKN